MDKKQRKTFWILLIIGFLWFVCMIPANLTGAVTPDMLEIFEVDEYAQYPHVIRMLTKGDTAYQTLRNFFIYLHYYYGFPFYFWSALSIFPIKLFYGLENSRVTICVLRQMISVLPMLGSVLILTWLSGKYRHTGLSVLFFIFYLTIPAVLQNNFWWHPDSLTLLFICLVFFFLERDHLHFQKDFYLAAAACGAAIGTKYLGLYFALAIPVYLWIGMFFKRIDVKGALKYAGLFVLGMILFVLISNPLLLLPQERSEIFRTMSEQMELSGNGIFVKYENNFFADGLIPKYIQANYASSIMIVLSLIGLIAGFFQGNEKRSFSFVLAAYLLVALIINLNTQAQRLHYYLPILLPLFTALSNFLEIGGSRSKLSLYFFTLILSVQVGLNTQTDISLYKTQLNRETDSPAIQLYHTFSSEYLPLKEVPPERMTRIFRDWKIYFPEQQGYAIMTDWEMATQAKINEWHPDLIFLEQENIRQFASKESLENAVDRNEMEPIHSFYSAAHENRIPGYQELYSNSFAKVFIKE